MLRAILDACPGPIHAKRADGTVVFANGPMAKLYGKTPEQVVGQNIRTIHYNLAEVEAYLKVDHQVLETGVEVRNELTFTPPGGARHYFESVRRRIISDDGEALVLVIGTDITAARRAEAAAADLGARWTLALEGLRDGVWDWDLVQQSMAYSPRWKAMLGYEAHELPDTFEMFERLLHPEDLPRMRARLADHLERRAPYELVLRLRSKNCGWRSIHVRGQASWAADGTPLRMSGSHSDVTESLAAATELREANAFLEAIQRHIPLGLFVKCIDDAHFGQYVLWNETCGRLFGRDPKDVIGLTSFEIYGAEVGATMDRSDREAVAKRAPLDLPPLRTVNSSGQEQWLRTIKVPLFDAEGQPTWLLGMTEDVTERLRSDRDREAARTHAEDASRIKSQFLANMSHEIRTPMNGVVGLLALALDTKLPEEARELLTSAQVSAHNLLAIIGDILDLSKIESGKVTLEAAPFSLREVARDAAVVLLTRADEKGLDLIVDVAPEVPDLVRGDVVRVRQILTNLLSNAVKFTAHGAVRLEIDLPAEGGVRLSVVDTGVGIAPDKLESIFLPFTQEDASTTRRFGGTGLGLTISRELARAMGGEIVATSELGQGSRFDVTLRLPAVGAVGPPPLADLPVLLLAERPFSAAADARALSSLGAVVHTVPGARPAVVVIDGDPAHVEAMLEALPSWVPPVPVIAVVPPMAVEHGTHEPRLACTLCKPAMSKELHRAISRVLKPSSISAKPLHPPERTLTGLRVLLAEDNPINTLVAIKMLERMGCVVEPTTNGREALARFQGATYDAVLLDMQMPEMDGLECSRAIRAVEGAGDHTPVIALTANAMQGDDALCLAAGMDAYLAKPIDLAKLRAVLLELTAARPRAPFESHPSATGS